MNLCSQGCHRCFVEGDFATGLCFLAVNSRSIVCWVQEPLRCHNARVVVLCSSAKALDTGTSLCPTSMETTAGGCSISLAPSVHRIDFTTRGAVETAQDGTRSARRLDNQSFGLSSLFELHETSMLPESQHRSTQNCMQVVLSNLVPFCTNRILKLAHKGFYPFASIL